MLVFQVYKQVVYLLKQYNILTKTGVSISDVTWLCVFCCCCCVFVVVVSFLYLYLFVIQLLFQF